MDRTPLVTPRPSRLPLLVIVLCMVQPVMDSISYWTSAAGANNNITLLMRLLVLAVTAVTGFLLSRRKWVYFVLAAVLAVLTAGHIALCAVYGYQAPMTDLTNLVRIYQLPVTVFAFITFLRRDNRCLDALKQGFFGSFALIVAVELIATLTHTDPHTYANKGIGVLGWFMTPNAQSAILSMVVPVAILFVMERTKSHPLFTALAGVVGLGTLYLLATRLAYAALVGCAFALAAACVIIRLSRREPLGKAAVIFAVLGLAAVLLRGVSPMTANNEVVSGYLDLKYVHVDLLIDRDADAAEEAGLEGEALELASLKSAYEFYVPGLVSRFGLAKTAEHYHYTTDASTLASIRMLRNSYCQMLQQEQPLTRLFGVELGDLIHRGDTYDAENDFHGIYYLCGGAGLLLTLAFLGFFLVRILLALLRNFRHYFTLSAAGFGIALICALAHAYFTAGVLRRPNSNFYLAAILAAVYILTEKNPDIKEEKLTMVLTKTLRPLLKEKLPQFVLILFVIQPVMDVISFWIAKWGISNVITLLMRLAVLAVTLAAGFLLSQRKRHYVFAAAVCAFIGIGHIFACWQAGYQNIITDLSNYIRVIQLPLFVLCLITFLRENEACYEALKKGITLCLTIILAVQVVAILTNTDPHTYPDGRGFIGWFSNTNTQSSILAMIAPIAVAWLYQKKGLKNPWLWICMIGSGFSMYFLGTRLAYLGIVAMVFGLGVSILIIRLKDWKKALCFLLTGVLFICLMPLSPMMGHRGSWADEMADKQGWGDHMIQDPDRLPEPEDPDPEDPDPEGHPLYSEELVNSLTETQKQRIAELTPMYEHFVSDLVGVFGIERTVVLFNYSDDITVLTAARDKKLMVAQALMDSSPFMAKLFGVELSRFTIHKNNYDVENDFHGIYYLYGIVGLAAMLLFLAYFVILIAWALIRKFKRYFTLDAAGWGIALVMCLGHCYFTASTLRRPSSSVYLAAVLAAVFYLIKIKKYSED